MTKEEKKEQELQTIIQNLTLMDDEFMSAVFQDNLDGTNLVLRIFLNKPELNVHRVIAQHTLTNLQKRGVRLDIHAFGYGKEFDIEIQRAGRGAEPEGVAHMCKAIEDFAEKRAEEEREQWILRSVRKVMKNMKVTAKKAMDVLELDAETQKKYLPLL